MYRNCFDFAIVTGGPMFIFLLIMCPGFSVTTTVIPEKDRQCHKTGNNQQKSGNTFYACRRGHRQNLDILF